MAGCVELSPFVTPLLTLFGVVVGWVVVHVLTRRRDIEKAQIDLGRDAAKERRECARDILKMLREIEDKAVSFHSSTTYSAKDAEALNRLLGRISRELRFLQPSTYAEHISQLRSAMTLRNFEEQEFGDVDVQPILMELRTACASIEESLLPECRLWVAPSPKIFLSGPKSSKLVRKSR